MYGLGAFSVVLVIIVISLGAALGTQKDKIIEINKENDVCLTKACISAGITKIKIKFNNCMNLIIYS